MSNVDPVKVEALADLLPEADCGESGEDVIVDYISYATALLLAGVEVPSVDGVGSQTGVDRVPGGAL